MYLYYFVWVENTLKLVCVHNVSNILYPNDVIFYFFCTGLKDIVEEGVLLSDGLASVRNSLVNGFSNLKRKKLLPDNPDMGNSKESRTLSVNSDVSKYNSKESRSISVSSAVYSGDTFMPDTGEMNDLSRVVKRSRVESPLDADVKLRENCELNILILCESNILMSSHHECLVLHDLVKYYPVNVCI